MVPGGPTRGGVRGAHARLTPGCAALRGRLAGGFRQMNRRKQMLPPSFLPSAKLSSALLPAVKPETQGFFSQSVGFFKAGGLG